MLSDSERNELFNGHTALAYSCVSKHWARHMCEYDDLKQEALLALWDATDTYDSSQAAFSTYATICINFRLARYAMCDIFGAIGDNCYFRTALSRVRESLQTNRPIESVLEENKDTKIIRHYAIMLLNNAFRPISLDAPVVLCESGNEAISSVAEFIQDGHNLEDEVCRKLREEYILDFFDNKFVKIRLDCIQGDPERKKKLMAYYRERIFGKKVSQAQIAKEVGLTRSAVNSQFRRWDSILKNYLAYVLV